MKRFTLAAMMCVICIALTACSDDGGGDNPNALKKIVFVGYQSASSDGDIYVMNEDGSNIVNLTQTADHESRPNWSPDGTKIYFIKYNAGVYDLYVMNQDGSNQQKIYSAVSGGDYNISPDGSKIALRSWDGSDEEIYVINSDGTGLTIMTDNDLLDDACPSWSPDGNWIAFVSNRDGGGSNYNVYVMSSLSGSIVYKLTSYNDVQFEVPQWSPDGTRIAFRRYGNFLLSNNHELFIIGTNGSNLTNISKNSSNDYYPLWSPDGSKIAFASEIDGNF
ncbi:MAG: DUF5050 domain-containing protein, partial [Spirochaetes bacterium]|nr:DUF5050 domain-containing protein [Spirochaetota bacterium]